MAYNVMSSKNIYGLQCETHKKSKSLILLCKFCAWAQKSTKIPQKNFALIGDELKFFYRYGIF